MVSRAQESEPIRKRYTLNQDALMRLLGPRFREKPQIEEKLDARLLVRNNQVILECRTMTKMRKAARLFSDLLSPPPSPEARKTGPSADPFPVPYHAGVVTAGRKSNVFLKTPGQVRYFKAVSKHDLVFVIGPAGTGKTYLAVAMAVEALKTKAVERIVLVRPAVEAGESLGYLPGNLREKIEPYLMPLYDALFDILPREAVRSYFEEKAIEVSPLAYMRGRTLNSSFIILDEAQNTTLAQMKMFLTRLGHGSKAVVAGDVTQIDLEASRSGLVSAQEVLRDVEGVSFVHMDSADVVRHRLVKRIIHAYQDFEGRHGDQV